MDFSTDERTELLKKELVDFMYGHIYPAEAAYQEELENLENPYAWSESPILQKLRAEARRRGLWNLFLPGEEGAGLTNVQYAPLAEITGRSRMLAPAALNCSAPDTGNMELLAEFGTKEQKEQWLKPLLEGE